MIALHCTRRVFDRFGLEIESDPPPPSTVLGSWYANLLNVERRRLVLCVSERTLMPVIIPARKNEFPDRLGSYLEPVLLALGIPSAQVEAEVVGVADFVIAKTQSRQVLGVMNDFSQMAKFYMPSDDLVDVSLWLAESPSKPLGYFSPDRETRKVFEESSEAHVS